MTTKVISKLEPKNSGAFPTHSDIHTEGGFQVRTDTTDRDSIPSANRKQGMWVKVQSDGKVYTLSGGITNGDWVEVTMGGGAGGGPTYDGPASGTDPENLKSGRANFPSPIDNTKMGIVNLGSMTGGPVDGAINDFATISGGNDCVASGMWSVVSGGNANMASGESSVVSGGTYNSASGILSCVTGGQSNNAFSDSSCAVGGNANNVTGTCAAILGGASNSTNAEQSIILGGFANGTEASNSVVMGSYGIGRRFAGLTHSAGSFGGNGEAQYTRCVLLGNSSSAAPTFLTFGDSTSLTFTSSSSSLISLVNISLVAGETGGTAGAAFTYTFLVETSGSGSSTIIGGTPSPVFSSNTPGYTVTISIDTTTLNQLNIEFTGVSADARAVATVECTELQF